MEDGSRQKRRLPQLGSICEAGQILGEIVSNESAISLEQKRIVSRRSENLSP